MVLIRPSSSLSLRGAIDKYESRCDKRAAREGRKTRARERAAGVFVASASGEGAVSLGYFSRGASRRFENGLLSLFSLYLFFFLLPLRRLYAFTRCVTGGACIARARARH